MYKKYEKWSYYSWDSWTLLTFLLNIDVRRQKCHNLEIPHSFCLTFHNDDDDDDEFWFRKNLVSKKVSDLVSKFWFRFHSDFWFHNSLTKVTKSYPLPILPGFAHSTTVFPSYLGLPIVPWFAHRIYLLSPFFPSPFPWIKFTISISFRCDKIAKHFRFVTFALVDCPTQLTLISHLWIFLFVSCISEQISKLQIWKKYSREINYGCVGPAEQMFNLPCWQADLQTISSIHFFLDFL